MELQTYRPADDGVLWRVPLFGRQTVPAGRSYWWENARRQPAGAVVLQAILAGSIFYRDGRGDHHAGPGDLLLFAYGEPTAYGRPEPLNETYSCAWVGLQGAGVTEHLGVFRRRHGSIRRLGLGHPVLTDLDRLVTLAEPQTATPPYRLAQAAYALVMGVFEHAEHSRFEELTPVERAIEHLLRQPHLPLSVDQVAQRFGCSREHLSRLFHMRVGQAAADYLAEARRRRALRLLRETDLPLDAIAEQCGFTSPHTLARHVRQATGASPSRLRADHRTVR